ncbi:MAG: MATE family efflux transporter [Pseudomonadota bacterium]
MTQIASNPEPLDRRRVLSLVWPVVLAQAAIAMTGIVDTAAMGTFGDKTDLAAVAVAAVSFSFIYWGFGFLRMSTTGLTAQAAGAKDIPEMRAVLLRSLILGGGLGIVLLMLSPLLKTAAFAIFEAEADVETLGKAYFDARIWGAPALLMGYGISGWFLGTGRTGKLLAFQIVTNGVNVALDLYFVAILDWGPAGIGAGTAIAEWSALIFGLVLVRRAFTGHGALFDRDKLVRLFTANRDIMIRTLALLFSFAWFVNAGARQGTAELAGNEVLLQFVTVAAFVLDGFAFIAEKETGEAVGGNDPVRLRRAVRITTELALISGVIISLIFYLGGGVIIRTFILDPEAQAAALAYLPYCALMPVLGVFAFQLDGIFIGAIQGRAIRNAGVLSTLGYVMTDLALRPYDNLGVWLAFLSMYLWRAGMLAIHWPGLMKSVEESDVGSENAPP